MNTDEISTQHSTAQHSTAQHNIIIILKSGKVQALYSTGLTATYISPAPVLTTPALAARGLGFVAYIGGNPITTHEFHLNAHYLLNNPEGGGYYSFSMYLPYRFLKINDDFVPGYAIPVSDFPFNLVVFSVTEGYLGNEWPHHYFPQSNESTSHGVAIALPAITVAQRTCTTPYAADGIIRLQIIYPNDLPTIGSTVQEREFVLYMDCPTHLGRVGFYIEPVHGIANEDKGVININPSSSAKGIGLQITTNKKPNTALDNIYNGNWPGVHAPIKFGPSNPYVWSDSYSLSPSFSGSENPLTSRNIFQTAPLKVAIYRTGTVEPGTFTAAIRVHIVYK